MELRVHAPATVAEAIDLLEDLGERARPYAGGTALLPQPPAGVRDFVDLKGVPELADVREETGGLHLGATVTLRRLAGDAVVRRHTPELAALPGRIANPRVLSAATLGGNLRLAHPRTDPPTLLAALGARVRCAGPEGERELAVEDLWSAGRPALGPSELITGVRVPAAGRGAAVRTARFNPRGWPTANAAVTLRAAGGRVADARVVVAASGAPAARHPAAEAHLRGRALREVGEDLPAPGVRPAADEHGSGEYKRHLAGVLTGRAARAAAAALLEEEPRP